MAHFCCASENLHEWNEIGDLFWDVIETSWRSPASVQTSNGLLKSGNANGVSLLIVHFNSSKASCCSEVWFHLVFSFNKLVRVTIECGHLGQTSWQWLIRLINWCSLHSFLRVLTLNIESIIFGWGFRLSLVMMWPKCSVSVCPQNFDVLLKTS